MDDDTIRELVVRLARPHPSGGSVIERAAILAAGTDSSEVVKWITAHEGEPEARAAATGSGGLHSSRMQSSSGADRAPLRYVFPAGALAG